MLDARYWMPDQVRHDKSDIQRTGFSMHNAGSFLFYSENTHKYHIMFLTIRNYMNNFLKIGENKE
jgi:hypothetical protein